MKIFKKLCENMYSLQHTGQKGCGYAKFRINATKVPQNPQIQPVQQETTVKDFSLHKTS